MKQDADLYTRDAFDKPRPGRPRKPDALTPAERARRYRERCRQAGFTPALKVSADMLAEVRSLVEDLLDFCQELGANDAQRQQLDNLGDDLLWALSELNTRLSQG